MHYSSNNPKNERIIRVLIEFCNIILLDKIVLEWRRNMIGDIKRKGSILGILIFIEIIRRK